MSSVFDQHPLRSLPRFATVSAYFSSRPEREDEYIVACGGTWNTGDDLRDEEVVTLYLATTPKELLALRNPLGVGPRLPLVLIARGLSMEEIETACEQAKDRASMASPDNVNSLDWLLTWSEVGRGFSGLQRRRPFIAEPRQLLYG